MPILSLRVTNTNQDELIEYFNTKPILSEYVIGTTELGTKNESPHYHSVIWLYDYKINSFLKDLKRRGIIKSGNENFSSKTIKDDDDVEISRLVKYACKEGYSCIKNNVYTTQWIIDNPWKGEIKATKEEAFLHQISRAFETYLKERWPHPIKGKPTVRETTAWIINYHHDKRIFDKFIIKRFYNYLISKYVDHDYIVDNITEYILNN